MSETGVNTCREDINEHDDHQIDIDISMEMGDTTWKFVVEMRRPMGIGFYD